MSGSFAVFVRELKLAWSGGGGAALPVGFFAAAASMTPFAVGNEIGNLQIAGPGVMWIALALLVRQGGREPPVGARHGPRHCRAGG
jgi:ABC-type transport system involved in cytochrome c biogenesis permease component